MKKMENFLRRALSVLLSICMLLGNVNLSFAESASVVSESTGPLFDYIEYYDQLINTSLDLTYQGTSDYVYNGSGYDTLEDYMAWYWVDVSVSQWVQSISVKLNASEAPSGQPRVALYRGDDADSVDMYTMLGSSIGYTVTGTTTGTETILTASTNEYNMPNGVFRFLVGLPIADDKVVAMLNDGETLTYSASNIQINGTAGSNTNGTSHTVSFAPVVNKTATRIQTYAGNYIRWELTYQSGIKLHNTIVTDTINDGKFINYGSQISTGWYQSESSLQAYDHGYLINGGQTISDDGKTITFNLTGINDGKDYAEALRYNYTTDLKLVYFSQVNNWNFNNVVSEYTVVPNGIAGTEIYGAGGINGSRKVVEVRLQRVENGGEPVYITNSNGNKSIWVCLTEATHTSMANSGTVRATATDETGIYKAYVPIDSTYNELCLSTAQNITTNSIVYNGGVFTLDANKNGDDALDDFVVSVNDKGSSAVITLTNYIQTFPINLKIQSYDEATGAYTPVAPLNADNPNLYLVYMDAEGNALSTVVKLTKTGTGTYTAALSVPEGSEAANALAEGDAGATVADGSGLNVLTLKSQKSYSEQYNADNYDRYYVGKATDSSIFVDCVSGTTSMDEYFGMEVENNNGTLNVALTNNRASALQGLVDAYNKGELEVNEESGAFTDYDGGKYFNELSPLGIAGSFHIVAFDTANLGTHTNGNVLARNLNAGANFGTNDYEFELSYVENYLTVHSGSASKAEHILALGSGNELGLFDDGSITVNGTKMDRPKNIIIDKDEEHPFIDIDQVEAEVRSLSATLASNSENVGISEDFTSGHTAIHLISNTGAGYYNLHASTLANFMNGEGLQLHFSSQHQGSIVMNVDCSGMTDIKLPKARIYIDGEKQGVGEVTTFENGKVIWNFINVGSGTSITTNEMTGMIIAPDAHVEMPTNINGTIIAKTTHNTGETHRTDFTGTTAPASGAFSAVKQVNGETPASDEKFWFVLEEKNADGTWTELQRKQNSGSTIEFENITYTEAGDHIYRIRELDVDVADGYTISSAVYYIEVDVYASTALGNTALGKKYKFWSDSQELTGSHDFIFNNTRDTIDLVLIKQDQDDETILLEGAQFTLTKPDGTTVDATTNEEGRISFVSLPDGTYTITETVAPVGYKLPANPTWTFTKSGSSYTGTGTFENAAFDGINLTINNEKDEKISISGTKTWVDNNNENDNRPETITIRLFANDTEVASQTVDAIDGATWTFDNLPVVDEEGVNIAYSISEDAITGYTPQVNGFNITNTEEKVSVSGTKTWVGDDNTVALTRPDSITVRLWNGDTEVSNQTTNADADWDYSFTNLPKYIGGELVTYTITEDAVPGYTATVNGTSLTNTLITTKLEGEKFWNDQNDAYSLRPDEIDITLVKTVNDTESVVTTRTVSRYEDWKWSFTGLPTMEKAADGTYYPVTYKVQEVEVPGYTTALSEDGTSITNTQVTTDINGTKTWVDEENKYSTRPASITVNLEQNGTKLKEITTTAEKGWVWSFTNLPKYDAEGEEYVYTVYENELYNYDTSYNQESYVITNTLRTTNLSGVKSWDDDNDKYGLRPSSVTIQVMDGNKVVATVVADEDSQWKWSVSGLPKYDAVNGALIVYNVLENPVPTGYTAIHGDNLSINNVLDTIDLSGTKTWVDEENKYSTRPTDISITVTSADGTITKTVTTTADEDWAWEIVGLPMFNAEGDEMVYTVTEAPVTGYTSEMIKDEETGVYKLINTLKTTDVSVLKVWEDQENAENTHPTSLKVQLSANESAMGEPVTLTGDDWSYTWLGLPKCNADGSEIIYTVDEVSVPDGYVKVVTGDATTGFVITNTYIAPTQAELEAQKVLQGPTVLTAGQFTFQLKDADGNMLQEKTNDATGKVTFDAINYETAGTYTYTINEVKGSVGGYTYDETVYDVTVTVTQDPADKQLSTTVAYTNLTAGTAVPTFVNTYVVKPDSLQIPVIKHYVVSEELKDTAPDITNDFTFTLEAVTVGAPMPADAEDSKATITNSVNEAEVYFGEIEFAVAGDYEYKITESGSVAGVDNDVIAERNVKIVVTDDGVGNLSAAFAADSVSVVEYTNTYGVEDGKAIIPVKKTLNVPTGLTGPVTDVADAYSFTIANVEGAPMPAGSNVISLPLKGGSGSFGEITFTEPGEYKYTITESCSLGYIDSDPQLVRNVTVIVTDNGEGQLVTDVQVGDEKADTVSYTNTYTATPDTITIPVEKVYAVEEGLKAPDITGKFTFTLAHSEGAPKPANGVMSITNDGTATGFDTITFDKVGTYTYTITESGSVPGVKNDTESSKTVTVTVTDNGEGELTASSTLAEGAKVTFTNRYEVGKTTAKIPVEKILKKSADLTGPSITEAFTFALEAVDGAPMPKDGVITIKNPSAEGGTAYFGEIEFDKPGDYKYTVTESGEVAGITNDVTATKDVTIKVSDDGQGNLSAAVVGNGGSKVTFTNEYKVEAAKASIPVEKKLVGKQPGLTLPDITMKFTFTLTAVDDAPLPATTSITNDGSAMSFGEITFAKAGIYKYTVAESGEVAGVTNDDKKDVTITVVDNKDGTMTATVTCDESSTVTFTNVYDVEKTTVQIPVEKTLSVPTGLTGPEADVTFTFTLAEKNNANMPAAGGEVITISLKNGVKEASFGAIEYTAPGTYEYTVTEAGTAAGVTNDTAEKEVSVIVTDDGTGKLSAVVSFGEDKAQKVSYTNTYGATPDYVSIPVTKVLTSEPTGLTRPDINKKYQFKITGSDGAPMPEKTEYTYDGKEMTFGPIKFTAVGVYTYTITESGSVPGVTNDTELKQVKVTVTDDGKGNLTAESSLAADAKITFTNVYRVGNVKVSIPAKKIFTVKEGQTGLDVTGKFTFTLKALTEDAPMPADGEEVKSNPDKDGGIVTFGEIEFVKPGVYIYEVTESVTGRNDNKLPGVTNDKQMTKTVTVTVTDHSDGTMSLTCTSTTDDPISFTNSYVADPVVASIPVEKLLEADDDLNVPDITNDFTFTLKAVEEGNPMPTVNVCTNPNADGGEMSFGPISFDKVGTYNYTITETGEVDGVSTDSAKNVSITVVDNGDGTLSATVTPESGEVVTFINKYTVNPTTASIPVKKTVSIPEGQTGPGNVDGQFTFTLAAVTEGAPVPAVMQITNSGESFSFGDMTFTKPGSFQYTVTESGEVAGITNDETSTMNVLVTVTDNGDGTLSAVVTGNDGEYAHFTNNYNAKPVTYSIPVEKSLSVAEGLTAPNITGAYTFTISGSEPLPETKSFTNADGVDMTFGPMEYTSEGTYTYTIAETGEVAGVQNDSVKTVTVKVADDGKGNLIIKETSLSEDESVVFTNTYTVGKAEISIPVEKVLVVADNLKGTDITGKFTFTLAAVGKAPIPQECQKTNPAADGGTVTFGPITYTEPGTYTYTVTESGEVDGVTNDTNSERTITVTVVDNGNGTMTATASTATTPVVFTNTYEVEDVPVTVPVEKSLSYADGLTPPDIDGKFTFTITGEDEDAPLPKVKTLTYTEDADGHPVAMSFGPINFSHEGTWTYTITESGKVDGISNDSKKTFTVTVIDNGDGSLSAITSLNGASVSFVNEYDVEDTFVSIPVEKLLSIPAGLDGPEDITGLFTFTLTRHEENTSAPLPEQCVLTNQDKDGGVVTFGQITYTKPGTYKYWVTESGNVDGITNDATATKLVTVTVVDNSNGTMTATASSTTDAPLTFTNDYDVTDTTVSFPVEKVLNVPNGLTAGSIKYAFTFTLTAEEGTPMPDVTSYTNPDDDGGVVTFGQITYSKPGTYIYTVTEDGSAAGVTNDGTASKTVTVTVDDNGNGTMTATASSTADAPLTFTNRYDTDDAIAKIPVMKVLEIVGGDDPASIAGKFTFELDAVTEGAPMPEVTSYTNPDEDGGMVTFGDITFAAPGSYEYTVTETVTEGVDVSGITNDTEAVKPVTITVTDNGAGKLIAAVSVSESKPLTFTNTYDVEDTTASIPVEKVLNVPTGLTAGDISNVFTFTLAAVGTAPMPECISLTNPDADGGEMTFGEITFSAPGIYRYTVTESGSFGGVTNDEKATKDVTITVVDDGDGTMTATVETETGDVLTFENDYDVADTTVSFPIEKKVAAAQGLTAPDIKDLFSFTLSAADGVPMPDTIRYTNPDKDGGVVTFGDITYTMPGTYVYTVSEAVAAGKTAGGFTLAGDLTVTVTVRDNGDGTMTATATSTEDNTLAFTNSYNVEETVASIPVKKILAADSDLDPASIAGKFTFTLEAVTEGAPMPDVTSYTNPDEDGGEVTFGEMTYTVPGIYKYKITETGSGDGITNDMTSARYATVTVTDNGNGTLTAVCSNTDASPVTFTNTYDVEVGKVSFPVEKILEVPEGLTAADITGKFTFTLTAEEGTPMPDVTSYTNPDEDGGVVTFGDITYTQVGTYVYTITETGTADGVSNDSEAAKTVTVEVVDNGSGQLVATASANADEPLTFTNSYNVGETKASIPVKKVLTAAEGLTPGSIEGKFTFTLTAEEGTPMPAQTVLKNPAANGGTVTFGDIVYTEPGRFVYEVTETGSADGVTNDVTTTKTVTVTVVDNGNGTLTATSTATAGVPVVFTNDYTVKKTTVSFPVEKILEVPEGLNGTNIANKFTFTLTAAEGVPMPEVAEYTNPNANGGVVTFGDIEYTMPGTYIYTITETGEVDGIVNDTEASKTVTVTVVDNGDGSLTATASSTTESPLTFTNRYEVEPTRISFPVKKILQVAEELNAPDITGKFTFALTAEDGTPVPTVTSYTNPAADGGVVTFGDITYTEPGIYYYTITETGDVDGITNDTTASKTVTVTVVDNGDGTLTATADSTAAQPLTFTNTYTVEDVTASIPVKKMLIVPEGLTAGNITDAFTFILSASEETPDAPMPATTVYTNPASNGGTVVFGTITYAVPGVYKYTVAESGSFDGVTNDSEAIKEVTVTVVDNSDGTLTATVTATEAEPLTFTNRYDVTPTTASIPVKKTLSVPEGLSAASIAGKFTFTLTAADGIPMPVVTSYTNPDKDGGVVTFGDIEYAMPGTYTYTVTETGSVDGITNDTKPAKTVTVTVVDNGNGTLTATASSTEEAPLTFVNDYGTEDCKVSFPVKKILAADSDLDPAGIAGKFTFTLAAETENAPMPDVTSYTNPDKDGGVVTFGVITYSMPGTYEYTVTESVTEGADVDGITNDAQLTKPITVVVEDNGLGKLVATVSATDDEPLTFTNTYTVKPTEISFPVEKILTVPKGLEAADITGKFTFTLTAAEGTPVPTVTSYTNPDKDGGVVTFGSIEYAKPGKYVYTITESGSAPGVTNDATAAKTVTVNVVDNGDGTLTATATSTVASPLTFTNSYSVEPTTISFPVRKVLDVADGLTAPDITGKYTFSLEAEAGIPMPAVTSYTNSAADGGVVTFGDIKYTEPGVYEYTITESGKVDGITNDAEDKTVTVTVVDNGDGTLTATADSTATDPVTFTNTYTVEPTALSFPVKKILMVPEGLEANSIAGLFTFALTAAEGTPMPKVTSYTNPDANGGVVTFGDIEYTEPGIYVYTITETGSADGVTNDEQASKTVTVTVVDNSDGTLTATASSTEASPLTFTNTYKVEPTTAAFPVEKILTVPEGLTPDSIEGKFTFELAAVGIAPLPAQIVYTTPDADGGVITFGDIEYAMPGIYAYTITESGEVAGITNDAQATKNVTVTVVDNGDGTLTATATATEEAPLTFTNTYSVEPTKASFPVKKLLDAEGLNPASIAGKFTFTMTAAVGVPMPEVTEYTNPDADGGVVTFGEIEYTKPGDYTYTITETGSMAGVTNDSEAAAGKTVTVTVKDNGDGTLTATADSTTDDPLTFTNTYKVKPTTAQIPVQKVLDKATGLTPASIEGKFTFTLSAAEGTPMPETTSYTNPAVDGGKVTFGDITFTAPGTYEYNIEETGSADGVTNDAEPVKAVTIEVVDNGDGTLTAEVPVSDEKPLTFTNTYTVEPTTASFPVEKLLEVEKDDTAPDITGAFTFEVEALDGAPLPDTIRYTNPDADGGEVTFGEMTYTMPGTYKYTVTEIGSVTGVINDATATKDVTVVVVDNGNGTLTATATATTEAPLTFTNSYKVVDINVQKVWNDDSNRDGMRPETIQVQLMADGKAEGDAVKLDDSNSWKYIWSELPRYSTSSVDSPITYTVKEIVDDTTLTKYDVEVGYTWDTEGNGDVAITNTHTPETVEITGSKTWVDLDNKYLKRPDSVTIRLLADGVEVDSRKVTEAENWSWTFTGLPKYKVGEVGKAITYTVTEDVVTGYITTINDFNVTNTMNLVEFIKLDEQTGKRLPGASFALYEGTAATYDPSKPVETWVSTSDTKILAGLKVGQTYTIVETAAPSGYAMMAPFQFTVELTDIPGTYRSFSLSNCHVYRFRKLDSATGALVEGAHMAVTDANNNVIISWYSSNDNDGWYEIADSKLYAGVQYKLVELDSPWGYEMAEPIPFSIDETDGKLIINGSKSNALDMVMYDEPWPEVTPTPEPTETSFTVTKRWEDKDNVLGLRPSSITVHLYRKLRTDAEYPTVPFMTVNMMSNGKDVWKFTFNDLPRRSPDGILYDYSIREELVEGYVVSYLNNGRTIVNTIPEEDYPPTPTPTLPYVTPTPTRMPRIPAGVQFVDGEWMYIDEYGIPLGGIPLTGDNTNFVLWGMAIGLPLLVAALAAVEIRRRKKLLVAAEQDEEVEEEA